ncbi:MAG: hypothetical protein WAN34_05090 [Acidimicrobiia bacterium]
MTKLENRIREGLNGAAQALPDTAITTTEKPSSRRRAVLTGAAAVMLIVGLIGGTALIWNSSSRAIGPGAAPAIFDNGYALSEHETATLMVKCLQEQGLDVTQRGNGIEFDDRIVSESDFEAESQSCRARLRAAGFLLPGDNPDNIKVGYAQYEALADCYRSVGITISEAPPLDQFIDDYQFGTSLWSPQDQAIQQVGRDATQAAENGCHIPTPEEVWSDS